MPHAAVKKIELTAFAEYLQPRPRDAHKGDFGHVLIVGGDAGYSGAVRLAAEAALRTGAGLVSVATHAVHAAVLNSTCPEIMCHAVQKSADLVPLLQRASVVVLGPGLGRSAWGKELFQLVLMQQQPLVIDADGLNQLAEVPQHNANWILTPHPGEAGRLLGVKTEQVQQDRLAAIGQLQQRYGGVVVLKGAGTLVLGPEGKTSMCAAGNPGMATAGMGDVLSGVIGSLTAQHLPLEIAATLGVELHASAGDLAAKEGERGMIASDLMPFLRRLMNSCGKK